MTDESLESGTPSPASGPKVGVGRRALMVLAALTAVATVSLMVSMNGTEAAPKAVSQSAVTLDVTQAAAYAATSANTVEIKGYAFAPAAVTVPVGTTVTWINEDSVPHTVTSTSGPAKFDSGQLASGASWSGTFMTPGTYKYYCADHPQMVAHHRTDDEAVHHAADHPVVDAPDHAGQLLRERAQLVHVHAEQLLQQLVRPGTQQRAQQLDEHARAAQRYRRPVRCAPGAHHADPAHRHRAPG
jgi:plastocyanin